MAKTAAALLIGTALAAVAAPAAAGPSEDTDSPMSRTGCLISMRSRSARASW